MEVEEDNGLLAEGEAEEDHVSRGKVFSKKLI